MSKLDELIQEFCPDGVEYKALGEICKLVTGATPSKTNTAYWENGTIPWMSSGEVNLKRVTATEKKITQLGYEKNSTTIVPKHSVVIALAGQGKTRGKVAITEIELCTNQSLCSMICNENLDYKFLYYILDGKYEELRAISNGDGTRGGLSLKILAPYKIPVPPLPVQREIVRILDNFTELTTELTARKKQYEFYRDKLLTFDVLGEETSKVAWRTLGDIIVSLNTGLNPRQFFRLNTDDASNYYVTIREIQNGTIVFSDKTDRINDEALRLCNNRSNLEVGDVLFSGTGTIGETAVISEPPMNWNIKEGVYAIKPQKDVLDSRYLMYILRTDALKTAIAKKVAGGTVKSIPMAEMRKLKVPVPSLAVQERLVNVLDNFDAICSDLNIGLPAEIEARQKQYEYYRDKLLTFAESGSTILTDRQTGLIKLIQYVFGYAPVALSEIATISRGGNFQKKDFTATGHPCIHYGQMYTHFGVSATKSLTRVSDDIFAKSKIAEPGDIVMAVTSENVEDVCKCVAWLGSEAVAVSGHTAIIHHDQNPKYLSYYFHSSMFAAQKQKLAHGTKVIEVTPSKLGDIIIPLPSMEKQNQIVAIKFLFLLLMSKTAL